ncbi:MAG: zinc metalloprotease HtpX [Acidobacteria bacterium RIFCSPLOWO2_02_FULL_68_18]|nr:MAG: zinc metalloprotease HtpX [Acidobacteria bacterium RIFCSPLOWO2_02_FULL_68_18]OFW50712.1 MAG: zinc metalloprotease HtpX [Acidobacteria bacterium RIFCSPLOWO2_12_FULL_68_19]
MGKRIFLFLVTNLAIVVTLSIVLSLLGVGRYVGPAGLDIRALAVFCFVWGMGGAFISLQMSRFIARQATGARLIDGKSGREDLDWLYGAVSRLTQQANLPMPEVAVYDSPEVNAFATGPSRSRSLVAVSAGLLRTMRREEVEGVLAHEVAHISNGDMVTMTLLQGVINAFVMFFARILAFALASRGGRDDRSTGPSWMAVIMLEIVFGILGSLVTAWFSRQREFRADRGGATLAGRDRMLAALRRLAAGRELVDTRHQALATLKINGARGWMVFFSTHPPLEARIAALEQFAQV